MSAGSIDLQDPPEIGSALLRWANAFDTGSKDVEPEYFSGNLPEESQLSTDNWIPRWQNLKYLNRATMAYIRDERGLYPHFIKRLSPDLKAIATDSSKSDLLQLLKMVFLAAFFCPNSNQRMVQMMMDLGAPVGAPIAQWITQIETMDKQLGEASEGRGEVASDVDGVMSPRRQGAESPQPAAYDRDPELEREERLLRAQASIRELERQNMDLVTQLEENRGFQRRLEDDLTEVRYRLERGGSNDAKSDIVESLQSRANQDKDYIAQLEQDLEATKDAAESYDRQLQKLQAENEDQQRLRDELQLLKVERDDLLQKSKANENLKKKIVSMQESEKNSLTIREELEAAQDQLRTLETYKKRAAALQKVNEENMKTLANTEQEIFDQRTTRKRLDHEIKLLMQRWDTAKERQQRDADTIKDQQERISELEAGGGKSLDDMDVLDDELSSKNKAQAELRAKVAKLEAENLRLQEASIDATSAPPSDQHKQQIDTLRLRIEKLEKQYLDAYQTSLGLEFSLKTPKDDAEQTQPFLHLKDALHAEIKAKEVAERKITDLEAHLAELRSSLQETESKLAIVDKDKAAAADELRQSVDTETENLKDENKRLLQYIKLSGEDLDDQRSLLRHSLLHTQALLREDPKPRSENETKLVMEELQTLREKPEAVEDVARHLAARIEDTRLAVSEAQSKAAEERVRLEDQIITLEARLKKAQSEPSATSSTPMQENVKRELQLVTSAWYDMNTRLQSDAVVIQRRSEAPRSFLGRQRRLVSRS